MELSVPDFSFLFPFMPLLKELLFLFMLFIYGTPFSLMVLSNFFRGHPGGRALHLSPVNFFQFDPLLLMASIQLTTVRFLTLNEFWSGRTTPWGSTNTWSLTWCFPWFRWSTAGCCLSKLPSVHVDLIPSDPITYRGSGVMVYNAVTRDRPLYCPFNLLNTQAAIDHSILNDGIICYVLSNIEKSYITSWKNNVVSEVPFIQELFFHKAPPMRSDISIDVNSYSPVDTMWKRSPADPTSPIMPGNPRRCPLPARNPDPAMIGVGKPATVVERGPTPFPI
jgi:hypothetical protein